MKQSNDTQLKQALAKMLPEVLEMETQYSDMKFYGLAWKNKQSHPAVLDTELLHLCWLVEENIALKGEYRIYSDLLGNFISATWQQRVSALAKVKGIEV